MNAAHILTIESVSEGWPKWKLECLHPDDEPAWLSREEDGTPLRDDQQECWLMSWWEAVGAELVEINVEVTTLPIPVRPEDWTYPDGGVIGYDISAIRTHPTGEPS